MNSFALLISAGFGTFGKNLEIAPNLIICDPWWKIGKN